MRKDCLQPQLSNVLVGKFQNLRITSKKKYIWVCNCRQVFVHVKFCHFKWHADVSYQLYSSIAILPNFSQLHFHGNNFPQVLMDHEVSGRATNNDLWWAKSVIFLFFVSKSFFNYHRFPWVSNTRNVISGKKLRKS